MPSHTAHSALIKLYFCPEANGAPWSWPQWQNITGIRHGLFPADDDKLPDDWTREDANNVYSFFSEYNRRVGEEAKKHFCANYKDGNHRVAGDIWTKFVRKHWEKWKIHDTIVKAFRQAGVHPMTLMVDSGSLDWPDATSYIPIAVDSIGMALFGEDAFGEKDLLNGDIRKCTQILAQCSWTRIRNRVSADKGKLTNLESLAVQAFEALDKEGATRASLVKMLRAVSHWRNLADSYGTDVNLQKADEMLSAVERLLERCGARIQKKSMVESSVPKEFKVNTAQVKSLATEADILYLQSLYEEFFNEISDGDDILNSGSSTLSVELGDTASGDLGMDVEQKMSPEEISHQLGFSKAGLPLQFNIHRHTAGLTAWEKDHASIFEHDSPEIIPNRLHWHQLAGVHSFARAVFTPESNPEACTGFLISDEVGLGKTAQVISIIAYLNQSITLEERKRSETQEVTDLPPILEKRRFLAGKDSIESLPHLIIVPGTLKNQWIRELQTLFRPRSIDILVYENPKPKSPSFWGPDGPFGLSKHRAHNKIIIMTHSCLQTQMGKAYSSKLTKGSKPWELPSRKKLFSLDDTIFSQNFLTVSVDEVHQMRNAGTKHFGVLRIYQQAKIKIALTGTPLLTGPKDISALGRLLGVPYFLTEESINDEKEDNSTFRRVKKFDDDGQELRKAQLTAVRRMQTQFLGHILRRTTTSVSWENKPLILLPDPIEITGVIQLTHRETKIMDERAEEARAMVMSSNETGQLRTRKFYHEYRTAVSYALESADDPLPVFQTLDEWMPKKSTKMDICARVCQHYLSGDNVQDIEFVDGKLVLPKVDHPPVEQKQERKILIYSESPSVTVLLKNVLELYGIASLSIDGSQTFDKRDKIVERFYQPSTARVLIFSSVGAAGLNLSIADVVVFFNQVWSYQDAVQIFARAYRQPQKKHVRAIHLLAAESSDLLLNAIALRKKDMFSGFVNKELGQELSDLLSGQAVCRPEENVDLDQRVIEHFDKLDQKAKEASEKPLKEKRPKNTAVKRSRKKKEEVAAPPQDSSTNASTAQDKDASTNPSTNKDKDSTHAATPTDLVDDQGSPMRISDHDPDSLMRISEAGTGPGTEPDPSSDGVSMGGIRESDQDHDMAGDHHDFNSKVPTVEEEDDWDPFIPNRGARRRQLSSPTSPSPCPKRPRSELAPLHMVAKSIPNPGAEKAIRNDGLIPKSGPQNPQNLSMNSGPPPSSTSTSHSGPQIRRMNPFLRSKDVGMGPPARVPPPSSNASTQNAPPDWPRINPYFKQRKDVVVNPTALPLSTSTPSSSSSTSQSGAQSAPKINPFLRPMVPEKPQLSSTLEYPPHRQPSFVDLDDHSTPPRNALKHLIRKPAQGRNKKV